MIKYTKYILTGICVFGAADVLADSSPKYRSMLGEDYVFVEIGTTIFDEVPFDSREVSFRAATGANLGVISHFDVGFMFSHERVDATIFDEKWDIRDNTIVVMGKVYGTLSEHIRPYLTVGVGGVHSEVIVEGEKFTDTTYVYGGGGGFEIQMFPSTVLDLSVIWNDRGEFEDSGFEIPEFQRITTNLKATQFFNDHLSGSLRMAYGNELNDTTFGAAMNIHF